MFNQITLIGHLGRDPEMRYTQTGMEMLSFSIGVTEGVKQADNTWKNKTMWMRVTVFGKYAETLNDRLKKGTKVMVQGRLGYDEKTGSPKLFTRQDGSAGASFEMVAASVVMLGTKDGATGEASAKADAPMVDDEEMPF